VRGSILSLESPWGKGRKNAKMGERMGGREGLSNNHTGVVYTKRRKLKNRGSTRKVEESFYRTLEAVQ